MNYLIYPYNDNLYSIINNLEYFNSDIKIDVAVYQKAWKKSIVNTKLLKDVYLTDDYEEYIDQIKGVIISDVTSKDYMYIDIIKKIGIALEHKKEVIICTKVKYEDIEAFKIKYPDADIKNIYDDTHNYKYNIIKYERQECIAVGIGPLYRGLDDLVSSVYLAREFQEKGYKTIVISPNQSSRLLGFYPFPIDIFNNSEDIEYKIEQLNSYFSQLEKESKCDIMIIQFPDGMMKFSDYTNDSHGIKAYMLAHSVSIDYFVLTSMYDICENDQYDKIRKYFIKNFGFNFDSCVLQPTRLQYDFNPEYREYSFTQNKITEYGLRVKELINKHPDIMFELNDTECYKSIVNHCINKLS